jgi:hypothetical protein
MGLFDLFSSDDAQKAAQAQTAGIQQGYSQLSDLYGQGRGALTTNYTAGLQPFLTNFSNANQGTTALGNALGLNGQSGNQAAIQAFQNNPGYQFQLQQGDNAINAAAAANGTLNSGNQLKALSDYNQGLAGTSWQNYVSNLQPYLNAAQGAAYGIGNLYSGLGSTLGNSFQGQGNAAYGANTSIGNANANAELANYNASGNLMNAGMSLASGLFGFLSDERAKDDIEPVGELYDGQKVYRYRYKGDHRHQIGLIAQEVEEREPDAVFDFTPELKGVDYKAATNFAAELARFAEAA